VVFLKYKLRNCCNLDHYNAECVNMFYFQTIVRNTVSLLQEFENKIMLRMVFAFWKVFELGCDSNCKAESVLKIISYDMVYKRN
jgi:hypothetical protein